MTARPRLTRAAAPTFIFLSLPFPSTSRPQIGYGSPQTLSDTGLKLAKGSRGDAPTLKPTFMVFAPTVLDRVRQAVQAKVAAAKPIGQKLFKAALNQGYRDYDKGKIGAHPLWNAIVFKKARLFGFEFATASAFAFAPAFAGA